ncbi:MAG: 5'/3'-nucleotidase SurE [bacterium]
MAMNILLSNDDGIRAEGLRVLKGIVERMGHTVFTVAPNRNQSATSHSLTLTSPLRIEQVGKNEWATTGTPTDCVLIATHGLIDKQMDLVISGINHGPNMGEDVLYSGTVAAAMEGLMMGIPSISISMASYFETDFSAAESIIHKLMDYILEIERKKILLNVNFPALPYSEIRGFEITELGSRIYSDSLIEKTDPRGKKYYWIGGSEPKYQRKEGTDFEAVRNNKVSVTPIKTDITDRDILKTLKEIEL